MSNIKESAENTQEAIPADIAAMSFETALKALDEIVAKRGKRPRRS